MKLQSIAWSILAGVLLLAAGNAAAQSAAQPSVEDTVNATAMFGIGRDNAVLVRYDFAGRQSRSIGTVRHGQGPAMTGIAAAAYFPGFENLYAFWLNPADGKNKLVYVNVTSAAGRIVAADVEGGKFTGAVGLQQDSTYTVFTVQQAKIRPPATIIGLCNINPNNNASNEFSCTRGDGTVFTRDHLHAAANLPADGTYYQGAATRFHVKPKGNGNQNGLIIDGRAYELQNSNTYTFEGSMVVRVYNDKPRSGKGMGHWWIQVISGQVYVNGVAEVLFPNRIATVDVKTGVVNEIARLSRAYSGLATTDGVTFYTTAGADLYRLQIDTVAGTATETKIATTALPKTSAMQFVSQYLMAYDITNMALAALQTTTGNTIGSPANLGLGTLGVIVFTPVAQDLTLRSSKAYD